MPNFRITPATAENRNLISLIRATAFDPQRAETACWFPTHDESLSTTHYIAWNRYNPVGVASVYAESESNAPAPYRLRRVSILPAYRGQGAGSLLVAAVFQEHNPIWASIRVHLEQFYARLGACPLPGAPYPMESGSHINILFSLR